MTKRLFSLLILAFLATIGCYRPQTQSTLGSGPIRVVVTTSMIADAVRNVGGAHVEVNALMGAGVDPHNYQPTPADAEALGSANIVFFNGLHLEGKMTDLLEHNQNKTMRAFAVTKSLDPKSHILPALGGDGAHDPHVWFDVRLWMKCVEVIRDELSSLDPAHSEAYAANTQKYLAQLQLLDSEVRTKSQEIPQARRVLVTSHDAFGYFAAAYGFEVRGLQGVSTSSAPGTKDVEELANFLGSRGISAVFCETSVRPKGLEKVLDTVKAKYSRTVHLVGGEESLYSDALGDPGTGGETYIGMVRHNIDVIVRNLKR